PPFRIRTPSRRSGYGSPSPACDDGGNLVIRASGLTGFLMGFFSRQAAEPLPERFEVTTEAAVVAVDLRRHPRARNYTLRVAGPQRPPVLTIPKRGTLTEARRFLDRHAGWLKSQIERLPPTTAFADGAPLPFRGVMYVIRHDPEGRAPVTI